MLFLFSITGLNCTEQVDLDRTIQKCIWEVLVGILARTPTILTEVYHGFVQSLQANARIVPNFTTTTSKSLSRHHSFYHPVLYGQDAEGVVKTLHKERKTDTNKSLSFKMVRIVHVLKFII